MALDDFLRFKFLVLLPVQWCEFVAVACLPCIDRLVYMAYAISNIDYNRDRDTYNRKGIQQAAPWVGIRSCRGMGYCTAVARPTVSEVDWPIGTTYRARVSTIEHQPLLV